VDSQNIRTDRGPSSASLKIVVSLVGEPYPIKLTKTGRASGQITFSGWNDPVTVSAPSNAIEISQLQTAKGR
jgi:hypothetical protein